MYLSKNMCLPMHIHGHPFEHVRSFFSLQTQILIFVIPALKVLLTIYIKTNKICIIENLKLTPK